MSRPAASKSRLDKTRGGTQATTPAIAHDIIPGKFTDQDWNLVMDIDDSEEFVSGLVEEIADNALKIIYNKYIERQLIPFTVELAKDAVLRIMEWYFLEHDEGENDVSLNPTFAQDEEPPPIMVDAWAQGVMVKRSVSVMDSAREDLGKIDEEIKVDEVSEEATGIKDASELSTEPTVVEPETPELTAEALQETQRSPSLDTPQPKPKAKIPFSSPRKVPFRPYVGRIKSAGTKNMTETLYETEMRLEREEQLMEKAPATQQTVQEMLKGMPASCHSILRVQLGRPPGNKEVVYDTTGNVVSVVRIEPDKLPSHKVNVDYKIIDPEVEASNARLDAIRRGYRATGKKKTQRAPTQTAATTDSRLRVVLDKMSDKASLGNASLMSKDAVNPLPPSLVDTIVLAPGVVVKEHEQVKCGPRQPKNRDLLPDANLKNLRPVKPPKAGTNRDQIASQIVDVRSFAVKPMQKLKPIPSIPTQ